MTYFYPNRPILIPADPKNPMHPTPDYLNQLDDSGRFVAEQKWNGDNIQLFTNDIPEFWNRYKERHGYQPPPAVREELERLPKKCCFNLELVNNRTITIKNLLVVHACMIWNDEPLIGKTWGESRKILEDLEYGTHIVLSRLWYTGFWDLYQAADGKDIEGIILKDPKGKLVFSTTPIKDVNWMKKVRKPSKKYSF